MKKDLTQELWVDPVAADSGIGEFERDEASFCLKPSLKGDSANSAQR
jgi:hypothetical protein